MGERIWPEEMSSGELGTFRRMAEEGGLEARLVKHLAHIAFKEQSGRDTDREF